MRLFPLLPILSLLFGARASSLDSRRPDAHPLDVRDAPDVCGGIDKELAVPDISTGAITSAGMLSQFDPTNFEGPHCNNNVHRCLPLYV